MGIDVAKGHAVSEQEDAGTVVHIRDETGEPAFDMVQGKQEPVTVTIRGSFSKTYRRIADAQTQRMFKKRQPGLTAEQWQANRMELTIGCITAWSGFTNAGKPFPFTPENAKVLLQACPWIHDQLAEAQSDHSSFSKASSGS